MSDDGVGGCGGVSGAGGSGGEEVEMARMVIGMLGPTGVGKTAVAVELARRLSESWPPPAAVATVRGAPPAEIPDAALARPRRPALGTGR